MQRAQVLAEQRKHPRAHLRFPARIRWHGPLGMLSEIAEIIDVSREGVLLIWRGDLPATMSRCWIVFPFDPSATGTLEPETPARIARIESDPGGAHRVGLQLQPRKRSDCSTIQPERRGFARVEVCLPIFVRSKGMPWPEEAMTRDFSRSGLRFETSDVYATGDRIRAEIPWGEWAEGGGIIGRVVRVEPAEDDAVIGRPADRLSGHSGTNIGFTCVAVEWIDTNTRTTCNLHG
ncbi:MAG: PilZ domain-containing protein [Candidatus Acidiferrales bacterium]